MDQLKELIKMYKEIIRLKQIRQQTLNDCFYLSAEIDTLKLVVSDLEKILMR